MLKLRLNKEDRMKRNFHRIELSILFVALLVCGWPGLASGQTGAISGHVTDMSNNGLAGVSVQVYTSSGSSVASASTDASGNYTVSSLANGSYKVGFGLTGYIYEYYNDKHGLAAADVVVVSGGGTTSNINAQLAPVPVDPFEPNNDMAHAATLSAGTYDNLVIDESAGDSDWFKVYVNAGQDLSVSTSNLLPLVNYGGDIDMFLYSGTGQLLAQNVSDRGNETVCLADMPAGWYYLTIPYGRTVYSLTVATGDLAVGAITGQLKNSLGSGVGNVFLWLYPYNDSSWSAICELVPTDVSGNFKIAYPVGTYKVYFDVTNYMYYGWSEPSDIYVLPEWYDNAATFGDAGAVTISSGGTTSWGAIGLEDGAAVSGQVVNNSVNPINAARIDGYNASGRGVGVAYTDASGNYTLKHVPLADGPQKLQFRAAGYAREWHNDKTSFSMADPLTLQARQTQAGVNAMLVPQGTISGRVTDVSYNGLFNLTVFAYDTVQTTVPVNSTTTAGDGSYTIAQLPTASVRVFFSTPNASPYMAEYYNDKLTFGSADSVSVTSGQNTANIDAQLALKSITITSPNGGERWLAGSPHYVKWTSSGGISNVKIEYTTNNWANSTTIAASTTNTGSYLWTLPASTYSGCLVRVSDVSNAGNFDVSNSVMAVVSAAWGQNGAFGDFDGDGAAELAVAFGSSGTWMYNAGAWSQLTPSNAESLAAADVDGDGADEILADLGSAGLWLWNAGSWGQISGVNVEGLTTGDVDADGTDEVAGDFGAVGLWLYNGGLWSQVSGINVDFAVTANLDGLGGNELIGDFAGIGLWVWSGGIWTQLSGVDADYVTAGKTGGAGYLLGDFGTTGLWTWSSGGGWTQLSGVNADNMITADTDADATDEILGDFGTVGLWLCDSGSWIQLSGVNADYMIRADIDGNGAAEVAADFGSIGLWLWNAGSWAQISSVNAEGIGAADLDGDGRDEIAAAFGALGLWLWNDGVWSQISPLNPD
jgi:hypothetical protein